MGFQSGDIVEFARGLLSVAGVTGVWVLAPDDRHTTMWIAVAGLDEEGHAHREGVRESVEVFIDKHETAMRISGFVFDYYVIVDEPELRAPQIPSGAVSLAA